MFESKAKNRRNCLYAILIEIGLKNHTGEQGEKINQGTSSFT